MDVCKKVLYRGRVQGVGFRFTAQEAARDYAVRGYVRNLPDGSVELVAEGDPAEIDPFLEAVSRYMAGNIHQQTITDEPLQNFQGFDIRY